MMFMQKRQNTTQPRMRPSCLMLSQSPVNLMAKGVYLQPAVFHLVDDTKIKSEKLEEFAIGKRASMRRPQEHAGCT